MFNRMALIFFCLLLFAFESRGEGLPAVVESINIGKRPSSAVLDEKGNILYAITESDTLEVVDVKGKTAVKSVRLDTALDRNMGGNALSFNPTNGRLYFPGDWGGRCDGIRHKIRKGLEENSKHEREEGLFHGSGP